MVGLARCIAMVLICEWFFCGDDDDEARGRVRVGRGFSH